MGEPYATITAAVAVFAGTNVDDIIVLTVLFLSARATGRPRSWQIWVGQYAGIAVLVAVSAAAALGLTVIPDRWVGLLGLVPFALGVRGLVAAIRGARDSGPPDGGARYNAARDSAASDSEGGHGEAMGAPVVATGLGSVAGVTIANGADNISVYTPLLRTIGLGRGLLTVAVFAALVALWCAAASWLGSHRRVIAAVRRFGHWIVPAVFMVLGAAIVVQSGVLGLDR